MVTGRRGCGHVVLYTRFMKLARDRASEALIRLGVLAGELLITRKHGSVMKFGNEIYFGLCLCFIQ